MLEKEIKCYCCSELLFKQCCEPYLSGKENAPTAETLMRSRYSAFATSSVNYLIKTHHPKTVNSVSAKELLAFCKHVYFFKLEIISTTKGLKANMDGRVKFKASFKSAGSVDVIAEDSYFEKINEIWYYKDGVHFKK